MQQLSTRMESEQGNVSGIKSFEQNHACWLNTGAEIEILQRSIRSGKYRGGPPDKQTNRLHTVCMLWRSRTRLSSARVPGYCSQIWICRSRDALQKNYSKFEPTYLGISVNSNCWMILAPQELQAGVIDSKRPLVSCNTRVFCAPKTGALERGGTCLDYVTFPITAVGHLNFVQTTNYRPISTHTDFEEYSGL